MPLIDSSLIHVSERQRKTIDTAKLNELKESIVNVGLLHPPVCHWSNGLTWELVAGERRLRAMQELHKEGREFRHSGILVPRSQIPITPLGDYLDDVGRFEAELDENIRRHDLDWPDQMRAYAALHAMRQKQNPEQTVRDTAKELAQRGGFATDKPGGTISRSAETAIRQATAIVPHLKNEKIANARNPSEALALVYRMEEDRVRAALVKRQLAASTQPAAVEIRRADALILLPKLEGDAYDLIIADPPYGISASSGGFRARTVVHHNYSDTPERAKDIAQAILTEGFRLTKSRANIFMFCDIDLFQWLKITAQNMGWTVFRRPLIWMKSESEGLAPWGGQGPRITTEFIFFATKGQRGLNASPIDVFDDRRVSRTERVHAAEKPVSLFSRLISCSTLPGDAVLDPCCGSGNSILAAKQLGRKGLGIEIDEDYYNSALASVMGDK
jgi:ParB-like chromosome segregation protein Spo0J